MQELLLVLLTLIPIVAIGTWLASGKFHIYSLHNLFLFVLFYFGVSVPVDLLLGLPLRYREGIIDLSDASVTPIILKVVIAHFLCLAGFVSGYHLFTRPIRKQTGACPGFVFPENYKIKLPGLWLVLLVEFFAINLYVSELWTFSRDMRATVVGDQFGAKLVVLFTTLSQALNIIYIWLSGDRKKSFIVLVASLVFSIGTGGRTAAIIFGLIYFMRYRVRLTRKRLAILLCFSFIYVFYWKLLAHNITVILSGQPDRVYPVSEYNPEFSFSRFEGVGAFSLFATILDTFEESPYWLGSSYVEKSVRLTWPRFLSDNPVQTLAEEYGAIYRPDFAARGGGIGFSAMAEAWLNFGWLGPIFIGFVVGLLLWRIDHSPQGLLFVVSYIMVLRFFRADFASLYKNYFLLTGGAMLCIVVFFRIIQMMTINQDEYRNVAIQS